MTLGAVVLHPHPSMGGDSTHPLVVAIADGLAAKGVAAVRPDLRDPNPQPSAAVLEEVATGLEAERVYLVGYSWGSVVSALAKPDGLAARVLVAPPVSMQFPDAGDGTRTLVLVPEHDQYGGPDAVRAALGEWENTTIEVVDGADHFVMGAVDQIATRVVEWLTS